MKEINFFFCKFQRILDTHKYFSKISDSISIMTFARFDISTKIYNIDNIQTFIHFYRNRNAVNTQKRRASHCFVLFIVESMNNQYGKKE